MIRLGANISSLNAQRRLAEASTSLSKTFERLSSGMRINSASDDAAGIAIADTLRSDRRVYLQGVRNLNDGLSLLNVADAAIENLSAIVVRIQELTEQAANGSYGNKQREALDAEAQALSKEFTRIAQSTEFNGRRLFTGQLGSVQLQAGIGADAILAGGLGGAIGTGTFGSPIAIAGSGVGAMAVGDFNGDGIEDIVTATAGAYLTLQFGTGNGTFSSGITLSTPNGTQSDVIAADFNNDGILDIASLRVGASFTVRIGNGDGTFGTQSTYAVGAGASGIATGDFNGDGLMDIVTTSTGTTAQVNLARADGTFSAATSVNIGALSAKVTTGDVNGDGLDDFVVTAPTSPGVTVAISNGDGTFQAPDFYFSAANLGDVILTDLNGDGTLDIATPGSVRLGDGSGSFGNEFTLGGVNEIIALDANGDGITDLASQNSFHIGRGDGTFSSGVLLSGASSMAIGDFNGDGVVDIARNGLSILFGNSTEGIGALLPFSLATLADARQAMGPLERKLDSLNSQRGQIGAFQSRIEVAKNVLMMTAENYAAAESRIRDADIASEASNLVRLNILRQAAAAVLAQANQQPALVLKLLGGEN